MNKMQTINFEILKTKMQEVIDLVTSKNLIEANEKLSLLSVIIDDFLDVLSNENDLREIGRYQVLVMQLQQKIESYGKA